MKLGYAQTPITPLIENPVYLAGFGKNRIAVSVHDDLYARALALSDGNTCIVLCSLDLIGLFQNDVRDVIDRLEADYPNTQFIIASTHTHHGPDTQGLWGPDDKTRGIDEAYVDQLKQGICQTIRSSLALDLEVASCKIISVQVPGVVKNARDPDILDDELTVLQFLDPDQHPQLTLMNFPCHPEVLWEDNPHITSDYPGFLRQTVESQTGAPCIFFSGALGGMLTPDVVNHTFDEAQVIGQKMAQTGLTALRKADNIGISDQFLRYKHLKFKVKLQNPLFKFAIRRGLLPDMRDDRGFITSEVNLIQIGNCWLVTVPGELLPKLGLQIKYKLKSTGAQVTGIIGLANDELGYILPKEDFRYPFNPLNPKDHYEETMSISKHIGSILMETVDHLLMNMG
jgi:hypothetical protein